MRKICSSSRTERTSRLSAFALSRSVPNGFSMMMRTSASARSFQASIAFLTSAIVVSSAGILIGLGLSFTGTRLLQGMLHGVTRLDPETAMKRFSDDFIVPEVELNLPRKVDSPPK